MHFLSLRIILKFTCAQILKVFKKGDSTVLYIAGTNDLKVRKWKKQYNIEILIFECTLL